MAVRRLFSTQGLAELRRVVTARPLLAFDFDGTLAPIVARPDDARVPAPTSRRLGLLAASLRLAVITGRTVADVLPRLGFTPWQVIGSHGAEDPLEAETAELAVALEPVRVQIDRHAGELQRAGVSIEDKGLSIALHYRLARDREVAGQCITQALGGVGAHVTISHGKMVVNVVPKAANDKAAALRVLLARAGTTQAIFVGDDVNDEPVFEAGEPDWLTIRVGAAAVHTHARYFIESPLAMPRLLDELIAALGHRVAPDGD
jgi:trehalose 6-phosphate phosphatase